MKKWIFTSLTILLFAFSASVFAAQSDNKSAEELIKNWFEAMKNQQIDKASEVLAPQFVSIHTDGKVRDKKQEIKLIKKLEMKNYELTDFKFSQPNNDTIIVTYKDKAVEKIDNKEVDKKAAGRMAVLQKQDGKWLIIAYANLDQIG